MAFLRHGTPEKLDIVMITCSNCGAEFSLIVNNRCPECHHIINKKKIKLSKVGKKNVH